MPSLRSPLPEVPATGGVTVFSIGLGALSPEALAASLAETGIEAVVDVRRTPGFRRGDSALPGDHAEPVGGAGLVDAQTLRGALETVGLVLHLGGRHLGGPAPHDGSENGDGWGAGSEEAIQRWMSGPAFHVGIALLTRLAGRCRVAMLGSAADWRVCHRGLIADHLLQLGGSVIHLTPGVTAQHHPARYASAISRPQAH